MKNNFSKTWDEMTIPQRIEHLLADWKTCKDTQDPMILRVAATVAHHVLRQAKYRIEDLELIGEERCGNWKSADKELRAEIERLREALRKISSNQDEPYAADFARDALKEEK